MRFLCDSCHAQYMISDDKVGPRGVKVRCKKCGYVILVRRAEPAAATPEAPAPSAQDDNPREAAGGGAPSGGPGILQGVADEEIGAVFDQALTPGYGRPGAEAEVGSAAGQRQQESLEQPQGASFDMAGSPGTALDGAAPGSATQAAPAAQDWFVAIDEKQVGPLTLENVRDLWNRGELAADSLCWRAGLSDWVALSEAPELASVLAPRPSKPVIVATAPLGQTTAGPPSPIESAFSAGLTPRGIALDSAVASGAPSSAEQSGSWRPSAASALASLMKEEIEVMAKPAPRAAPPGTEVVGGGVLTDVSAPVNGHPGTSLSVKQARQNGAAAVVAPISISEPYPSTYPAPARGPRRGWIIGMSVTGGILVLALAVVTTMLVLRSGSSEPAGARPPGAEVGGRESTPPPAPQERAAPPQANPPTASTPQPQAAPAQPTAPKETGSAAASAEPVANSHYERGSRRERNRLAHRASNEEITVPRKPEKTEVASAPAAPAHSSAEDDFDRVFGGAEKRKSAIPKAEQPRKPSSVYVPPAPGSGEIQDSLGTADIMRVVVDNKPTIKQCVDEQRKRDASLSGKIVMSWTILASGKTASVSCASEEFKSSYMAQCLTGLIRGWQFPRHKVQGDPINFPFTF